jgi:hypothetical protein
MIVSCQRTKVKEPSIIFIDFDICDITQRVNLYAPMRAYYETDAKSDLVSMDTMHALFESLKTFKHQSPASAFTILKRSHMVPFKNIMVDDMHTAMTYWLQHPLDTILYVMCHGDCVTLKCRYHGHCISLSSVCCSV